VSTSSDVRDAKSLWRAFTSTGRGARQYVETRASVPFAMSDGDRRPLRLDTDGLSKHVVPI
jgi:hypothetical protein